MQYKHKPLQCAQDKTRIGPSRIKSHFDTTGKRPCKRAVTHVKAQAGYGRDLSQGFRCCNTGAA